MWSMYLMFSYVGTINKVQSINFIQLWKPDIILGEERILNSVSTSKFVNARIALEEKTAFSIVCNMNLIICNIPTENVHRIEACLWYPQEDKKYIFDKIKTWHAYNFQNCVLILGYNAKEYEVFF